MVGVESPFEMMTKFIWSTKETRRLLCSLYRASVEEIPPTQPTRLAVPFRGVVGGMSLNTQIAKTVLHRKPAYLMISKSASMIPVAKHLSFV